MIQPNLIICNMCPRHDYGTFGAHLCREKAGADYDTHVIDEQYNVPNNCNLRLEQLLDHDDLTSPALYMTKAGEKEYEPNKANY